MQICESLLTVDVSRQSQKKLNIKTDTGNKLESGNENCRVNPAKLSHVAQKTSTVLNTCWSQRIRPITTKPLVRKAHRQALEEGWHHENSHYDMNMSSTVVTDDANYG